MSTHPLHQALIDDGTATAHTVLHSPAAAGQPAGVMLTGIYCMGVEAGLYLAVVRPEIARALLEAIDTDMLEKYGSAASGMRMQERAAAVAIYEEAYT